MEEISKYFSEYKNIIEINIQPFGYVRRTRADAWKKRPIVEKYYAYKNELSYKLNLIGYKQSSILKIAFLLPIPQSLSNKQKNSLHLQLHNKKPDLDNLVKAFLDAATNQDNFVNLIQAAKFYSLEPKIILFI